MNIPELYAHIKVKCNLNYL